MIEAEADALGKLLSALELRLEESRRPESEPEQQEQDPVTQGEQAAAEPQRQAQKKADTETEAPEDESESAPASSDIVLTELVVRPGSSLDGRSASDLLLRTRYGLNLLAISRQGTRARTRLRAMPLRAGDLLLMQGPSETIAEFASDNGCVPLAQRELHIPSRRKAWQAGAIMLLSVGAAALG